MSVEPKIKLNLKALIPSDPQKTTAPALVTEENDNKIPNLTAPQVLSVPKEPIPVPEEIKSHNISFADIKKQIDKKNSPTEEKIEEIEVAEEIEKQELGEVPIAVPTEVLETEAQPQEKISNIVDEDVPNQTPNSDTIQEDSMELKTDGANILSKADTGLEKALLGEKKEEIIKEKKKFFSFFKRKKSDTKQKTTDTDDTENLIPKKGEKIHFSNYESHFKKESTNFLKRFQKFKYAPSTRIGMIMGLISLTVLSIASLMILFPEKHSLDIYKASILELSGKGPDTVVIDIVSPGGSQEPIPSPEEVILEETKEENNPSISSISTSQEKSKEILRQHLLNKYK